MGFSLNTWLYIAIGILTVALLGSAYFLIGQISDKSEQIAQQEMVIGGLYKSIEQSEASRIAEKQAKDEALADLVIIRKRAESDAINLKTYRDKLNKVISERPSDAGSLPRVYLDARRGLL